MAGFTRKDVHVNDSFILLSTAKVTDFFWNEEMFCGFSNAKSGFECNMSKEGRQRVDFAISTC